MWSELKIVLTVVRVKDYNYWKIQILLKKLIFWKYIENQKDIDRHMIKAI